MNKKQKRLWIETMIMFFLSAYLTISMFESETVNFESGVEPIIAAGIGTLIFAPILYFFIKKNHYVDGETFARKKYHELPPRHLVAIIATSSISAFIAKNFFSLDPFFGFAPTFFIILIILSFYNRLQEKQEGRK